MKLLRRRALISMMWAAVSLLGQQPAAVTTEPGSGAPGTGVIQGTASDAANHKPVVAAMVMVVRAGVPPVSQKVLSGADGTFQFQGLPTGIYSVCAQAPALGYLNPCEFAAVPVRINLTAGQTSTGNTVRMVAGSVVHLRIQDPQQLMAQASGKQTGTVPSTDISVGVWGPGEQGSRFYPARVTGIDSVGRDYQVTVPFDTSLALHVSSRHLKLGDSSGAALAGNALQQKFQRPSGDANPKSFTFSVTGLVP